MSLVFFSFSETDREFLEKIITHAHDKSYDSLDFRVAPLLDRWDTTSKTVMQNFILKIMKTTARTIVFIGDDTIESKWVPVEVDLSIELKHPVYAMRLKDSKGEPPECLLEHGIRVEDWDIEVLQYIATK